MNLRTGQTLLIVSAVFAQLGHRARADVVSDFSSNQAGWSVVSFGDLPSSNYSIAGTYAATYNATGGNPGGYISSTDPDGGDFTFSAPTAFLGNVSAATGLSYDLLYLNAVNYQTTDVMLVGNGERLLFQSSPNFVPGATWQTNTLSFTPSASWRVNTTTGAVATASDFQNVLGNLTGLYIRGEYANGPDNAGLDNVRLIGVGAAVPEPGSVLLLGSALVVSGMVLKARSHRGTRRRD